MDDLGEPRLNDTEALDLLFSKNGVSPARGSFNTIKRLRSILGENSREWGDFKGNVLRRMLTSHKTAPETGMNMQRMFSGDRFNSALQQLRQNKQAYEAIFTAKERFDLEKLAAAGRRITSRPPDPGNPSKSYAAGSATFRALLRKMGADGRTIAHWFQSFLSKGYRTVSTGEGSGRAAANRAGFNKGSVGADVHGPRRKVWVDKATGEIRQGYLDSDPIIPLNLHKRIPGMAQKYGISQHPEMRPGLMSLPAGRAYKSSQEPDETIQERTLRQKKARALKRMQEEARMEMEEDSY
jgi:hypothetical protein